MGKFQSYEILGHQLICPMCAGTQFVKRDAQLNTKLATFLSFDWADAAADCYICERCRHIIWFYKVGELL